MKSNLIDGRVSLIHCLNINNWSMFLSVSKKMLWMNCRYCLAMLFTRGRINFSSNIPINIFVPIGAGLSKLRARLNVHGACMKTSLFAYENSGHEYWFLCVKIIWICQSPTQTIIVKKNKIRTTTTTAFLISSTAVLNPVLPLHPAFNLQSFAPLS